MMGVRRVDTDVVDVQKNDLIDDNRQMMDSKYCTKDASVHSITMNFDSDDSLSGYASSRSVSPLLPELAEAEKEPQLNIGPGEILRPVYISQLVDLLRDHGSSDKNNEAEKVRVALDDAEALIRKKKNYGSELGKYLKCLVYLMLISQCFTQKRMQLILSAPFLGSRTITTCHSSARRGRPHSSHWSRHVLTW